MKRLFVILSFVGLFFCFMPEVSAQEFFDNETTTTDGLYDKNATGVREPEPFPYVREADVMWRKTIWREIDFRQKMNQGFYFPTEPHKDYKNIYTILTEALKDPTSGVVAYEDSPTGELLEQTTWETIEKNITEEKEGTRMGASGYEETYTYKEVLSPKDVKRLQIKEEWYFDKQKSELLVRIIAICPIKVEIDDNGEQQLSRLFWVPYNENLRKILVNAPFFNRSNSAAHLSYDDVFCKRIFDSYIIREDNIFDRNIGQYAKGVDALKESERIKQEIIDFEQSLWEY